MKLSWFALPLLAITACTDDGGFSEQAAEIEGIYRVDSHLRNDAACSPGGTAVSDMHSFAFAKRADFLGVATLQLVSCASLEDCRAKAAQTPFQGTISFTYTLTDTDGDALTGIEATSGWTGEGGTCTMPELSDLTLVLDGDALRLEKRTQIGADYQAKDGWCTTDAGRASAEDAPCSVFETLTATRLEAL